MRSDIIKKFCDGVKPVDLIKESQGGKATEDRGENKNTVYRYYEIYKRLFENLSSKNTINGLIKKLVDAL